MSTLIIRLKETLVNSGQLLATTYYIYIPFKFQEKNADYVLILLQNFAKIIVGKNFRSNIVH